MSELKKAMRKVYLAEMDLSDACSNDPDLNALVDELISLEEKIEAHISSAKHVDPRGDVTKQRHIFVELLSAQTKIIRLNTLISAALHQVVVSGSLESWEV
tara:strand:- start:122 stop:424 length:303 start_codon:yes stop_codon:yes gene_type:complete